MDKEKRMREVLTLHSWHWVSLNGGEPTPITDDSLKDDAMLWSYDGFVVDCRTCGINLSMKWK